MLTVDWYGVFGCPKNNPKNNSNPAKLVHCSMFYWKGYNILSKLLDGTMEPMN